MGPWPSPSLHLSAPSTLSIDTNSTHISLAPNRPSKTLHQPQALLRTTDIGARNSGTGHREGAEIYPSSAPDVQERWTGCAGSVALPRQFIASIVAVVLRGVDACAGQPFYRQQLSPQSLRGSIGRASPVVSAELG